MAFYDINLLKDMECPVCMDFMHPPIRQCVSGHSYCNDCFLKLKICAQCKLPLSFIARSYGMEALHDKMAFPCKNRDNGCVKIMVGPSIVQHQGECPFGTNVCPMGVINDCKWVGQFMDLVKHCQDEHEGSIYMNNTERLTCEKFATTYVPNKHIFQNIFYLYGCFFKCAWDVDYRTGYMRWCVFIMSGSSDKFEYEIEIPNENVSDERVILRGNCATVKFEDTDIFNNSQFLLTHCDMMRKFCKNYDLVYIVKIKKIEQ